ASTTRTPAERAPPHGRADRCAGNDNRDGRGSGRALAPVSPPRGLLSCNGVGVEAGRRRTRAPPGNTAMRTLPHGALLPLMLFAAAGFAGLAFAQVLEDEDTPPR